jgi:glycosyltransferase involved in cell wall biosynthesis
MKLLVLAPHPFFQNRGTPIAVKMLLEALSSFGHEITLITFPEGEDIAIPGCRIIRLSQLRFVKNIRPGFSWKKIVYDFLLFFKIKEVLQQQKFDLIHAVEESAFLAYYFSRQEKIPYVYDMDSSLPQQLCEKAFFLRPMLPLLKILEKKIVLGSIGILPVCKAIEDVVVSYATDHLVQRLEDVTLLPPVLKNAKRVTDTTAGSAEHPVIQVMYVGNLEKYQGIDLLLDAFAHVIKQRSNVELVIIGGAAEDVRHYSQKSVSMGIGSHVIFKGPRPVERLSEYLAQADILVSPRIKGFNTPMKIYSYLDSGKAVLATRMDTHTQVLDDSIACLVEPDAFSMANGLEKLITHDELRKKIAENAKLRVASEFTIDAFNKKLMKFYTNIEHRISGSL